jgi:3-isopropylmalate/(R)-2-methylmalate dehydratase small subunit
MNWEWHGRGWVFGDDVPNDEGIMPLQLTRRQEYDPEVLARHCFEQIDPALAGKMAPGDFVVAGKNFGHGNPHIQGFLGLKGLGVGLLVESMQRGPLRACVNAGVPVLVVPGVSRMVKTGDRLAVDFITGRITNEDSGEAFSAAPLPAVMRAIVEAGGGVFYMKERLRAELERVPPTGTG